MVLFLETKGCCQTFWGNMLCNEKLSGCRVLPAAGRWQQQGRRRERLSQSGIPVSPVPCSCACKGFTQTGEDGDWHCLKHHLSFSAFNFEKGGGCASPELFLLEGQTAVPTSGDAAAPL